jgi:hypothetical protein
MEIENHAVEEVLKSVFMKNPLEHESREGRRGEYF